MFTWLDKYIVEYVHKFAVYCYQLDDVPYLIIVWSIPLLLLILTLLSIRYLRHVCSKASDHFPKWSKWSKHCYDVDNYLEFREKYTTMCEQLKEVPKPCIDRLYANIVLLMLKNGMDCKTIDKDGTRAAHVKCLPECPPITLFDTTQLPKGFTYVTNPGRYKNFNNMRNWHLALWYSYVSLNVLVVCAVFALILHVILLFFNASIF